MPAVAESGRRENQPGDCDRSGKARAGVFSPLNWRRREIVEINAVFVTPGTRRVKVVDGKGRRLPHQLLKVRHMGRQKQELYYKEAWMLVEADIPASGYTTLNVEPDEGREEPAYIDEPATDLENRDARLRLGPEGIESLEDTTRGVRYAGAGSPCLLFGRGTGDLAVSRRSGQRQNHGERRPLEAVQLEEATQPRRDEGECAHKVGLRVSLYHSIERIDFDLTVQSGRQRLLRRQRAFRFRRQPLRRRSIPRPRTVIYRGSRSGRSRGWRECGRTSSMRITGVDYSDGKEGIGPDRRRGEAGIPVPTRKTRSLDHILLMTIVPRGEMETLFSNRFFKGTVAHQFHDSSCLTAATGEPLSGTATGAGATLSGTLEQCSSPCERRSSLGKKLSHSSARDRRDLRLAAETGRPSPAAQPERGSGSHVEIRLPFTPRACEPVDLNGRPWERPRIDLAHDTARFRIRPWEIVTLRFAASGSRG